MHYFEWHPIKATINLDKHGVSFSEAATVFFDDRVMLAPDTFHSSTENRLLAIGKSEARRILVVSFTYRRSKDYEKEIYRIISARIANKKERKVYAS